jgi:ABC-type transporter Mla MlaB component
VGSGDADTATAEETEYRQGPSRLVLRGDLPEAELDTLCAELYCARPASVDLSRLGTLEPATLAMLVSALRGLQREGACSLADIAPCAIPGSCLGAEGLAQLAGPEGSRWQRQGRRLLGWQTFASGQAALAAAISVALGLRHHSGWSIKSSAAMAGLAFELGENVRQHSDCLEGALALQTDPEGDRVTMAIADAGIGIRASLERNPKYDDLDDDLDAIEAAVRAGETGEPGTGGGMGLYLTRAMVRGNGGRVLVRSGEAGWEECEARRRRRGLEPLRGTLIGVEARTDRPLHDEELWARIDALSRSGGGGQ